MPRRRHFQSRRAFSNRDLKNIARDETSPVNVRNSAVRVLKKRGVVLGKKKKKREFVDEWGFGWPSY